MITSFKSKHDAVRIRNVAIVLSALLACVGLVAVPNASHASTPYAVFYNGNTIGTAVPASETQIRGSAFGLPPAASITGSRTGYTFGGWSLTPGGEPVANPYTNSSDANRLDLHAVWTTTLTYNSNGATSGSLASGKTSDVYRFGQTLTLPAAGTLSRPGFAFAGWMTASVSTNRSSTYSAGTLEPGNPTLFAAWIKTVSFNPNFATSGLTPGNLVFVAGGERLRLPTATEMTLRRAGYTFAGWSTTANGSVIQNPGSYEPLVAQQTLYAIWKVQGTKSSTRVFFAPGKANLRASQKLILRDLVDDLRGKTTISIRLAATRARSENATLGKNRNTSVLRYLESLGVKATFSRSNSVGKGVSPSATKNNRVTIEAKWVNPPL